MTRHEDIIHPSMKIEHYHVDAFTAEAFRGNPAAVVPLRSQELFDSDELLQMLAAEFNLPATAFYLAQDGNPSIQIKWFSPLKRIPICGHGSLAASHVIFEGWEGDRDSINYDAGPAGSFKALRSSDGSITLDFPACNLVGLEHAGKALRRGVDLHAVLKSALPSDAQFTVAGRGDRGGYVDLLVVELQEDYPLKEAEFDSQRLQILSPEIRGVTFTTRSTKDQSFQTHSRVLHTEIELGEDYVTGSAHCMIAPYWFQKLTLDPDAGELKAAQVSPRGGSMSLKWSKKNMRCLIRGTAITLGKGEWNVDWQKH